MPFPTGRAVAWIIGLVVGCALALPAIAAVTAGCGAPASQDSKAPVSPAADHPAEPGTAGQSNAACAVSVETPTGATLALEVAADPVSRTRGLGGRDGLAAGTAMALAFPQPVTVAIWMKDMRFDLDVVWVRGDRVVDLYEEMPAPEPGTPDKELPVYVGQAPADVVLELAGGTARALGLEPGARVRWRPASPAQVCAPR